MSSSSEVDPEESVSILPHDRYVEFLHYCNRFSIGFLNYNGIQSHEIFQNTMETVEVISAEMMDKYLNAFDDDSNAVYNVLHLSIIQVDSDETMCAMLDMVASRCTSLSLTFSTIIFDDLRLTPASWATLLDKIVIPHNPKVLNLTDLFRNRYEEAKECLPSLSRYFQSPQCFVTELTLGYYPPEDGSYDRPPRLNPPSLFPLVFPGIMSLKSLSSLCITNFIMGPDGGKGIGDLVRARGLGLKYLVIKEPIDVMPIISAICALSRMGNLGLETLILKTSRYFSKYDPLAKVFIDLVGCPGMTINRLTLYNPFHKGQRGLFMDVLWARNLHLKVVTVYGGTAVCVKRNMKLVKYVGNLAIRAIRAACVLLKFSESNPTKSLPVELIEIILFHLVNSKFHILHPRQISRIVLYATIVTHNSTQQEIMSALKSAHFPEKEMRSGKLGRNREDFIKLTECDQFMYKFVTPETVEWVTGLLTVDAEKERGELDRLSWDY